MKLEYNKKYLTIALYSVGSVVVAAAIILAMVNFDQVKAMFKGFFDLLSPFFLAFTLAYILNPILGFTEKLFQQLTRNKISRKLNRMVSMLITYAFAALIIYLFFKIVIPQLISSITSLTGLITAWVNGITPWINQLIIDYDLQNFNLAGIGSDTISKLTGTLTDMLKSFSNYLTIAIPQLVQTAASLATGVFNILMGIIISVYMLFSKERFFAHTKKLLYAFSPKGFANKSVDIVHESHRIFFGFIGGKLLDSAIIGVLCFIFMSIFRWPYTMLISVIVGVTNIIPYFGPFIGAIPSILILLIVDPKVAVLFSIFILALQQLDGNVIGPWILGDSTGLSSFWVIFSITVFSTILGPIGMFIGVPLFAVIYSLVRQLAAWRLEAKGLPVETKEYSSPDHPIL